jgi:hypothetical protein
MQRRSFLKAGLLGALALAAGGAVYRKLNPPLLERYAMDSNARTIVAALVPAMVGTMLPQEAVARQAALDGAVQRVAATIAGLSLTTQKEVADLFALLSLAPSRRLLAGIGDWQTATPEQLAEFLQSWRNHRIAMLQTAYHALHDIVLGAWYADPSSWTAVGYPGPLKELSA